MSPDPSPNQKAAAPTLLFVVNVAWFFCMHRLHLARAAQAAGFNVHVATSPDTPEDMEAIAQAGLHAHEIDIQRGRGSIVEELRLTSSLYSLYRRIRPDIVHHVTIKPVLCGTLAARLAGVPAIVNAMSGLGFVFTAADRWAPMRRFWVTSAYRILFANRATRVIFENNDDLSMFARRGIVSSRQAVLIRGAGVDVDRYRVSARCDTDRLLVVLPARMLWDKGVREFCEAAVLVRTAGVDARFALVGGLDQHNPSAIDESWLRKQEQLGAVEWWGHQKDMASVYAQASVVCLPSYREGLPTVLLEAAAAGCALVATDVPGCREVVLDGQTGLRVPPRDSNLLAQALGTLLSDQKLRRQLSEAAYTYVNKEFSTQMVQNSTIALYEQMLRSNS